MSQGIIVIKASISFAIIAKVKQPLPAPKKKRVASPFIPSIKFAPFINPTKARLKNTITNMSDSRR